MEQAPSTILESWDNPMGTQGFAFLEFAALDSQTLAQQFRSLGFEQVAKHKSLEVFLYQQGQISFILNNEARGFAHDFTSKHGPCACGMGFVVADAEQAYAKLLELGASAHEQEYSYLKEQRAIQGIGDSALYLVSGNDYFADFVFTSSAPTTTGPQLSYLDHVTHNVYRGNMDKWAGFYEKFFNFREIRYFDIEGKLTGLKSRAMTSPCGNIRIPINESSDDKSQIEEYLDAYCGEGIQHIAFGTNDIYHAVTMLTENNIDFLDVPDNYYEHIDSRVSGHQEDLAAMRKLSLLIDGAPTDNQGLLLQIFTKTC